VADSPRIEELRRRLLKDPASIAFAQLAEEHRRAGDLDEAIRVSEAGLEQHPGYLSARVTLGRALAELGRLDEAADEFSRVVEAAPDNLIAVRALADIHHRLGRTTDGHSGEGAAGASSEVPASATEPAVPGFLSEADVAVRGDTVESESAVQEPDVFASGKSDDEVAGPDTFEIDTAGPDTPETDTPEIETARIETVPSATVDTDASEPPGIAMTETPGPADGSATSAEEPSAAVPEPDPLVAELEAWLATLEDRHHAR